MVAWPVLQQCLVTQDQPRVPAKFTGTRAELFWRLVRGYLLMVPTLGLYPFLVTTMKRQFYWHNTSIDGDALGVHRHAVAAADRLSDRAGGLFAALHRVFLPFGPGRRP